MKAIETHYKGYRFRSRLEARWAVFFTSIGVRWEYEPQGYELADGSRYLPDFWIEADYGLFVEVKPYIGSFRYQFDKAKRFVDSGGTEFGAGILCAWGMPGPGPWTTFQRIERENKIATEEVLVMLTGFQQKAIEWGVFPTFSMPSAAAANNARSARFEHGECPA